MKDHILLVGPVPPPYGGIPTYVKSLSESNLKEHYGLILFNTAIPSFIRSFDHSVQRGYFAQLKSGLSTLIKLIAHIIFSLGEYVYNLIRRQPVIVHIFTCSYWGFWRNAFHIMVAKLLRRKTIFHVLGAIDIFYSRESGLLSKFLIKRTLNLADVLIVQSPKLKDFVSAISKKKVIVIFNGIDFHRFKKQPKYKDGIKLHANGKIILTVGALGHNKGTFDILKAIPLVVKNDFKVFFYFIGRGEVSKFLDVCRKLDIENYGKFLESVSEDEKIDLYLSSDIFILPSYAEGQPLAILEAMAAGLPVISTTVGSIPEVISDGENGFLIEPGDYEALADKINFLLANDEFRRKIGELNSKTARDKYDVKRVFREIAGVYDSLLNH